MRITCARTPPDDVIAAYNAPSPSARQKGELMACRSPWRVRKMTPETLCLYDALRDDPLPVLMLWGELDVVFLLALGHRPLRMRSDAGSTM